MASASTRVSSDDAPPPLPRPSLSRMSARSALASRASSRSGNLPRRARRSGMGRSNARGGGAVDGVGDPAARPATTSSRRSGELPTSPCICVTLCSLSPWSLSLSLATRSSTLLSIACVSLHTCLAHAPSNQLHSWQWQAQQPWPGQQQEQEQQAFAVGCHGAKVQLASSQQRQWPQLSKVAKHRQ